MGYWEGDRYIPSDYELQHTQQIQDKIATAGQPGQDFDPRNISNQDLGTYLTKSLYGESAKNIGQRASEYAGQVDQLATKDYAKADIRRKETADRVAINRAKTGLTGTSNLGLQEQLYRQGATEAQALNEQMRAQGLQLKGRNISAIQSGASSMEMGARGLTNAATPTPTPSYSGGFLGSVICTELYRQRKISLNTLCRTTKFGIRLNEDVYNGYLFIASPIVAMMKKSDTVSLLFVGWADRIASGKPGFITRLLMPICGVIGYAKRITKKEATRKA